MIGNPPASEPVNEPVNASANQATGVTARLRTFWILLVLFFAAWVPRVVALDAFVTVDERKWLARSANFLYALAHGDFANTFQREHPGVTVMWAGALGILQHFPDYLQQTPGYFTWSEQMIEAWLKTNTSHTPLELLAAGRWWIVLGVSLLLALSFLPLRRLLGEPLAALAVLMIAWMPWSVALSRQLHPDGFVASMIFVALVFFMSWLYTGRRWRDLVLSGVFMGLAWLTKTPAAFLVPTGALLIGVEIWRNRKSGGSSTRDLLLGYVLWGVIASAIFFLLWPSMWVNPLGTFAKMTMEMEEYVEGHSNPNFFMGQVTGDPGIIFYPVAWFFRATPATVFGLIAAAVAAARRSTPFDRPLVRRTALGFLLFGLLFTVLMTIPAKKFDRYLLPAFPAFEILAALGWAALAVWAGNWFARWWAARKGAPANTAGAAQPSADGSVSQQRSFWAAAGVVLVIGLVPLHSLLTALNYPYYLTYFNPLAGGSLTAPKVMIIGWGEGLDQVADWLNQQPDAENQKVISWYHDGPLSYFTKSEPVGLRYLNELAWLDDHIVVLYINQIQRQMPSKEAVDWYLTQEPVYRVEFNGIELARVYDTRGKSLPPYVGLDVDSTAIFGNQIQLLAHELDKETVQPGEEVFAQLYLHSMAPMEVNYNLLVRLVDEQGNEVWRADGWPWGAATRDWPVDEVRPDGHHIQIPADTPPGLYKLTMSFYDPDTFDTLPVLSAEDGSLIDAGTRDVALIRVGEPPAAETQFDPPWQFDRLFTLSGASLPATVAAGDTLPLTLQWDSAESTATDYTVFVHVVGPLGPNGEASEPVAQQDWQPLENFAPTHLWAQGQRVLDDRYAIALPGDLPPGQYEVRTGLYTADGRLPVSRGGEPAGDYAVVGTFEVK